ncbi:MAG: septum formation family protein [Acidimicrobiales bacterium]|nr:septum formation family protein [Acidimicrobiales bacterium]
MRGVSRGEEGDAVSTTVADLAGVLGLPPSAVLDQCQRLGIAATWAGAELTEDDVARLRAELATVATPAEDAAAGVSTSGGEAGSASGPLPPTAVGSRPDLIDEVSATDAEPEAEDDELPGSRPGFAGSTLGGAAERPNAAAAPEGTARRHLDRGTRHGAVWLVVALVAFGLSLTVRSPWMVGALWTGGAVALGFTFLDANRGRRQASLHPERIGGLGAAVLILVVAAAMSVALAAALVAVVRPDPAADVPVVGELESVQAARWGFHRVALVSGHGWKAPAKAEGTCWRERTDGSDEPRVDQRVEVGAVEVGCNRLHTVEVLSVVSLGRDLDAPYPGLEGFVAAAGDRCAAAVAAIDGAGDGSLLVEYPTEDGWADADHDVVCAVRFAEPRKGPLGS